MRSSMWFLAVGGAILAVEWALSPMLGGRAIGTVVLAPLQLTSGLVSEAQAIGIAVTDRDAAALSGTATVEPECGGWDVDSGGCHWICFLDNCPDNFDTFDSDSCTYCDYTASKQHGTRECSAGGFSSSCYETVVNSIIGCVVRG